MKVRAVWKNRIPRLRVKTVEWFLLLFGLAALDVFIWVNASASLYQAYADWAFDQKLRGLSPSVKGFAEDEVQTLPEANRKSEPLPAPIPPARSSVIGRLDIPRLRLTAMVLEGADSGTLRRAVGHIPGTALPGGAGNIALAGHRDTFFRDLRSIREDDAIELRTANGDYRYVVESTRIVGPRDLQVLAPTNGATLTLVTCYPFYYVGSAPKRFIVRAGLVAADLSRKAP